MKYDKSWQEIADIINSDNGTEYDKYNVRNLLKRVWLEIKESDADSAKMPMLFFTDPHTPYQIDGWLDFITYNYKKFGCKSIMCGGDLYDNHAISYHEHDPDLQSASDEMKKAFNATQKLFKLYPNIKLLYGNHDLLIARKIKSAGLPSNVMKPYKQIWGIPETAEIDFEFEIDGILFRHGDGSAGKDGAINTAVQEMRSFIQGHTHTYGGVKHHKTSGGYIFGANGGSLCDEHSRAMAYGKYFVKRPTPGCIIIYDKLTAMFVPYV